VLVGVQSGATQHYIFFILLLQAFFFNEVAGNLDTGCWDGLAHRIAAALAHAFVFTKAKHVRLAVTCRKRS